MRDFPSKVPLILAVAFGVTIGQIWGNGWSVDPIGHIPITFLISALCASVVVSLQILVTKMWHK